MSGLVRLRARIEPEGLPVLRILFAADGHPVCAREAPPWECAWDAGTDVAAHNIRAVAVLTDGSRLVDSVRTEAAGFAPVVDVDIVQVAATVNDDKAGSSKGSAARPSASSRTAGSRRSPSSSAPTPSASWWWSWT